MEVGFMEEGDRKTLAVGGGLGLVANNGVVYLLMDVAIMNYLGTSADRISTGKDKLVLQYDKSPKHGTFIGIGVKGKEKV
jgi:hypothetical protein